MEKVESLYREGILEEWEYEEIIREKQRSFDSLKVQMRSMAKDYGKVEEESLRVIELFGKASNFMELSSNKLDKARLARVVLSNPTLKDGTLCFFLPKTVR